MNDFPRTIDINVPSIPNGQTPWAREDLPGNHVRYHVPAEAIVTDSGATTAPTTAEPAVTVDLVSRMIGVALAVKAPSPTVPYLMESAWATTDPVTMRTVGLMLGMTPAEINEYDITYHQRFGWQAPDYSNGETKSPVNPEAADHSKCPNRAAVEAMVAKK